MQNCLDQTTDFEVSMDEKDWEFDENNILKSVLCFVNGKEKWVAVHWNECGAYVKNGTEKQYVLVNTN